MNKRLMWVIELNHPKYSWIPWGCHMVFETRKEAREHLDKFHDKSSVRVVKYVPAETSKKAGGK